MSDRLIALRRRFRNDCFYESIVEDATLGWLRLLGYAVHHLPAPQSEASRQVGGIGITAGEPAAERGSGISFSIKFITT